MVTVNLTPDQQATVLHALRKQQTFLLEQKGFVGAMQECAKKDELLAFWNAELADLECVLAAIRSA